MSSDEVRKLFQQLKPRKAIDDNKIPPTLIKIAAEPLSTPLSIAISNRFKQNIFSNNVKVACVKPVDKKTEHKHSISKFRPVSILNTFSEIHQKFSKDFLVFELEMFLSPFSAAYRKSYNTQHVLIKISSIQKVLQFSTCAHKIDRRVEGNLYNNFFVGVALTNVSKAFYCITHDSLIAKLSAYGLSSDHLCYIYSYLKDRKQCVQINNKQSEFDTIISSVPQGSVFGPVLFNIFFNDLFFFQTRLFVILRMTNFALCSFAKTLID